MAYCVKCGAYIPDGQSKCLACGYDGSAQQQTGQAGGYAYGSEYDQQRRQDQERERRQRQEEYRQQAEEEFRRRQAEQDRQERQAQQRASGHPYSSSGRVGGYSTRRSGSAADSKFLAAASYFGILCALPYIFRPQDRFAMFHAKQGVALLLFQIAAGIIGEVTGIGWILSLFSLVCVIKGVSGALSGRMERLPLIGQLADRIK